MSAAVQGLIMNRFEAIGFGAMLAGASLAMAYVSWPFASAIVWAVIAGIVFRPLFLRMLVPVKGHEGKAALLTLLVIVVAVVLPLTLIGSIVVDQAASLYFAMQSQDVDVAYYFASIHDGLPARLSQMLDSSGYGDLERVKEKIAQFVQSSLGVIASQALSIGSNALSFVLSFGVGLYVSFFLLRDGGRLSERVCSMIPIPGDMAAQLCARIASIVRATVKGSLVVGLVQGALGTVTFWITGVPSAVLLGVVMALASLLPAVGPALVWAPVAAWLFFTGSIWQAVVVIASGVMVVGMADNVLRPVLVGKDTGIPDWVILVTTLGGIAAFGLSGIILGPVIAGVFMTCWAMSLEIREGGLSRSSLSLGDAGTP